MSLTSGITKFREMCSSYFSLKRDGYLFTDKVSGEPVFLYIDKHGKKWMKSSRWSLFRVEHGK